MVIDISREVFSAPNYADDPSPSFEWVEKIGCGSDYNLSYIKMTPHSGTHIDAPLHYFKNGESVDEYILQRCFGNCTVVTIEGDLTGEDMEQLLPYCQKKLLLHGSGNATLTISAARVIAEQKIELVGIDSVSIAAPEEETAVHRELLSNGVIILENICLDNVPDNNYVLSAFPLKLGGLEAAPVRAVIITK